MKTQKITNDERFKSNLKKKFKLNVDSNAGNAGSIISNI